MKKNIILKVFLVLLLLLLSALSIFVLMLYNKSNTLPDNFDEIKQVQKEIPEPVSIEPKLEVPDEFEGQTYINNLITYSNEVGDSANIIREEIINNMAGDWENTVNQELVKVHSLYNKIKDLETPTEEIAEIHADYVENSLSNLPKIVNSLLEGIKTFNKDKLEKAIEYGEVYYEETAEYVQKFAERFKP